MADINKVPGKLRLDIISELSHLASDRLEGGAGLDTNDWPSPEEFHHLVSVSLQAAMFPNRSSGPTE